VNVKRKDEGGATVEKRKKEKEKKEGKEKEKRAMESI